MGDASEVDSAVAHDSPPLVSDVAGRVALVTGSARRLGAAVVQRLHRDGMNVVVHYRRSQDTASELVEQLNAQREDSAIALSADLGDTLALEPLIHRAADRWGRLDVLVNNASTYVATPVGKITESQFDDLFNSNVKGPTFLSQAAAQHLGRHNGCIVNMVDINAQRPLADYPVYSAAKAALAMITKALARELAPRVRVNGIAPGSILWAHDGSEDDPEHQKQFMDGVPMGRQGTVDDIANAVRFLIDPASDYITGQILNVDGGKALT